MTKPISISLIAALTFLFGALQQNLHAPVWCPLSINYTSLYMTILISVTIQFLYNTQAAVQKAWMWLSILTDQLLNDFSSLVGNPKPGPYTDALQSAAACNFQLNSVKCNKTMQEVLEDSGPGSSYS